MSPEKYEALFELSIPIVRKLSDMPHNSSFIIKGTRYSFANSYRRIDDPKLPDVNAYKNSIDDNGQYMWLNPDTEVEYLI